MSAFLFHGNKAYQVRYKWERVRELGKSLHTLETLVLFLGSYAGRIHKFIISTKTRLFGFIPGHIIGIKYIIILMFLLLFTINIILKKS